MAANTEKELLKIMRKHRRTLYSLRGVHYVDVGYKYTKGEKKPELAIRVHVYNKLSKNVLKNNLLPKKIDNAKTDVIVSHPVANHRFGVPFRILLGGIEIGNIFTNGKGTLGAFFKDDSNRIVGLTNYHVLLSNGGRAGDDVAQPFISMPRPSDLIGRVLRGNPDLDCAIFRLQGVRNFDDAIFQLTPQIINAAIPQIGTPVVKSGVATDVTFGIIDGGDGISFSVTRNPAKPNPGNIISSVGDSGSIWVLDDANRNIGVGLHFRGDFDGSRARFFNLRRVIGAMQINFLNH